jgi:hypothetical protein
MREKMDWKILRGLTLEWHDAGCWLLAAAKIVTFGSATGKFSVAGGLL